MKQTVREILLAVFMGLVVPWVVLRVASVFPAGELSVTEPEKPTATIQVLTDGVPVTMELDAYLTGVLLQELPGSFSQQTRMAQAVVARTYALKTSASGKHPGGAVCTDSACCQGYRTPEGGGALEAAAQAVSDTAGQILTYGGKLIEATYFSCSGGRTEAAVAVWGTDIPYLQAVESPGEEWALHDTDTVTFSADAFREALGLKLSGEPAGWFGSVTYTAGGGVASAYIGGTAFTGTQLRQKLGLRSTAMTFSTDGESVTVTTRGYGHRVGMSQYGAEAMARQGEDYRSILGHYYPGAQLAVLTG